MATIVNDRDTLLQAASPRDTDPTRGKTLILIGDAPAFQVSNVGVASPSSIVISASAINIPGTITWTVMSGASGVSVAGDTKSASLPYANMTAGSATIRAQVTYQGITYTAYLIINKVLDGQNGLTGLSTGVAYAYRRAASAPTDNPGAFTFTFASNSITTPSGDALSNGWTKTIPAGTDPLYVTVASASGTGATDTVAAGEWATPALFSQNGMNTATITLYQRATSTPTVPGSTLTYTFATGGLAGPLGSWSRTVPSGTSPIYVTTATALSSGTSDTITSGEWAAPTILAQNGTNGSDGSAGSDGQRGTVNIQTSGSSWSDSVANAAIASEGYGSPQNRDIVTITNGSSFSQSRFYDGGSWLVLTAYINGNLLVTGTLSASKISGGTFSGAQISIASGWFSVDASGNCSAGRLTGVSLSYDNTANPTQRPGTFTSFTGSSQLALYATSNSSSGTAHAFRANNAPAGSSGLVGAANGKAFYAEAGTYGPFTGAHDVALAIGAEIEPGDIVIDAQCLLRGGWSNTFFEVERSSVPLQRGAVGIYTRSLGRMADYHHMLPMTYGESLVDDGFGNLLGGPGTEQFEAVCHDYTVGEVNAVGEGQMNVCGEGGDIETGDFIVTSSIPGKGMRLDPDTPLTAGLMSAVVARAREAMSFSTPAEVKQIACIYISG